MKAKDLKRLIFRESKPTLRKFSPATDTAAMWAAYRAGSFAIEPDLTQEQFAVEAEKTVGGFDEVLMVEDRCRAFKAGSGPVCLVLASRAGMIVEPRFIFFKWATCRNILRATVAALSLLRASGKTGILIVRADEPRRRIAEHLRKYELLFFMGKSDEAEYLYSAKGRGSS